MRSRFSLSLMATLLLSTFAQAQSTTGEAGPLLQSELTGSVRLAHWQSNRQLNGQTGVTQVAGWLNGKVRYDKLKVVADAWLAEESTAKVERRTQRQHQVRELYVEHPMLGCNTRLGRQILSWGRADGINPTDRISPRDYTLLVAEESENQSGADGMTLRCEVGQGALLFGVFAPFGGSKVPLPSHPGFQYKPADATGPVRTAVKYEQSQGALDWSVSLYHGADTLPSTDQLSFDANGLIIQLRTPTVTVFGHDGSWTPAALTGTVLRWEVAYTTAGGNAKQAENVMAVIGAEYGLGGGGTLTGQWIGQKWMHFIKPEFAPDNPAGIAAMLDAPFNRRYDQNNQALMLRWRQPWLNDSLVSELTFLYDTRRQSSFVRAKLNYALNDHWQLNAGLDHFYGQEQSNFGVLRANNTAFVGVRRLF